MSSTKGCTRCVRPTRAFRTTHTGIGPDHEQVMERVWLCNPCRSDAAMENMRALWRSTRGWQQVDIRDLFW